MLKQIPNEYRYPGITRIANIIKLFPGIIEKNFSIPTYQFLILGDKGGYSEYIYNYYQTEMFEEPSGFVLFHRSNFQIKGLNTFTEGDINFETIQGISNNILLESGEPSLMLIISELSWKEKDCNLEEKYMKLYLGYSLYLSIKLLARGGNLIVKLYNTYHPATIEMIYLISSMFTSISLIKLLSSPPHSSVFFI